LLISLALYNTRTYTKQNESNITTRYTAAGLGEELMELSKPVVGNTANACDVNVTQHPDWNVPVS